MKKFLIPLIFVLSLQLVAATVTLEVTAFNCNPNEVSLTEDFSCTATVENSGDEAGSLTTATLYPDSGNWLESSSYAETVNTNIASGASADVVFEGLRAQKSGKYGFSRITLDAVSDTYPADNNVEVNVIDAVTVVSQSANSATASTGTIDASAQITVGGNVDILISFSIVSGGCTIGSQASSASFSDLSDGQSVSQTWTITMGTSNCVYRISTRATSNPSGTATKTDATTKTITCSGSSCTSSSSSSSSSSSGSSSAGGGSGGGGGGTSTTKENKEEEQPEIPRTAPEYAQDETTIGLDDYESWRENGQVSIENVHQGQTILFTYVNKELQEQDWIFYIEEVNETTGNVVLFLKQEGKEAREIFASLSSPTEIDIDNDGSIDLKITVTAIQGNATTILFEKTSSFLAQEEKLTQQKKGRGLIITISILACVVIAGGLYIFLRKKHSPKEEENPKQFYKKRK